MNKLIEDRKNMKKIMALLLCLGLTSVIAGAEKNREGSENDTEQKAELSGQTSKVSTDVEQRMQKNVTVDVRQADIGDVLRMLAEQADVDIIKSPKVSGEVTATLTDVPLEEALTNILSAHGFSYVLTGSMIRVAGAEEINQSTERLVDRIYTVTYADVEEVEKALKKFISSRASLSANPGTSNIIVTDTESKIRAIDNFMKIIDRQTPQILVEARIYDLTSTDRLDLGVQWQAGTRTAYGGGGLTDVGTNPTDNNRDPFMGSTFLGATGKADSTTGALRFGWLNSNIDIDAMISAQQDAVDAKLLANPRILVLDNETANIKIVQELPFQELTESSEGGSIGTTSFKDVGVQLGVTPHVTRDNMIRLHLLPEFSVKTGEVTFSGQDISYPQPIVDRRQADTKLLVEDGKTIVLGGLRKRDATVQVNKVPLLGDIPLLGNLFRFEGEDSVTSELVVFITPRIIRKPELSLTEAKQYEATEFSSPKPLETKAERGELRR